MPNLQAKIAARGRPPNQIPGPDPLFAMELRARPHNFVAHASGDACNPRRVRLRCGLDLRDLKFCGQYLRVGGELILQLAQERITIQRSRSPKFVLPDLNSST